MKRVVQLGMTVAVAMGVLGATAAPASAGAFPFTVNCPGTALDGIWTSNGNGPWVPAQDTKSTLVFHPTAFPSFTGTFTPSDPTLPPITVTDPPSARTNLPRNGQPIISCTYDFVETDPSGMFVGHGTVAGWLS